MVPISDFRDGCMECSYSRCRHWWHVRQDFTLPVSKACSRWSLSTADAEQYHTQVTVSNCQTVVNKMEQKCVVIETNLGLLSRPWYIHCTTCDTPTKHLPWIIILGQNGQSPPALLIYIPPPDYVCYIILLNSAFFHSSHACTEGDNTYLQRPSSCDQQYQLSLCTYSLA